MPTTGRHPRRRRVLPAVAAATALLALGLAVACGGGDDDGEAGTDPTAGDDTTTTTPTTAPPTPEEEAKAAYLEMTDVVYRLLTTNPDPDDPELQRVATEPVLGALRDSLATMRAENRIVERGDRTRQEVVSIVLQPTASATLRVCSIGNDRTIDQDDGAVVEEGASASLVDVAMVRTADGSWRVSDITTTQVFDGELECPL